MLRTQFLRSSDANMAEGDYHLQILVEDSEVENQQSDNDDRVTLLASAQATKKRIRRQARRMASLRTAAFKRRRLLHISIAITLCLCLCGLAVGIAIPALFKHTQSEGTGPSPSKLHVFTKAAVSSDALQCSEIGRDVLQRGGSAVDAAIATLFCSGVIHSQSMGLGGGFFMLIYLREEKKAVVLDARESAPEAATEDMYHGNGTTSQIGPLSIAVPGELKGYWEAYQKYGKVSWKSLVDPSIKLCTEGFAVTAHAAKALRLKERAVMAEPTMREIFMNPETGRVYEEGEWIVRPDLAATLTIIAEEGGNALYNGSLSKKLAQDLKEMGSIITEEDLNNYQAKWREPISLDINGGLTLHTAPPPASGALMAFIFNILNGYDLAGYDLDNVTTYHRIVEAYKYTYARRTELGDPDFVNVNELLDLLVSPSYGEKVRRKIKDDMTYNDPSAYGAVLYNPNDHGTSHVSILAQNGDAVSVTSTINVYYGSLLRSRQTGIILNDEMDDFSSPNITNYFNLPPSPANFIAPGKRPLSSICPAIFTNKDGDVRLAIGAAGGSKITSTTALAAMRYLWFNSTLKEAIDYRRIHHQLVPMQIQYEVGFPKRYLKRLEAIGHKVVPFDTFAAIINGVAADGEVVYANADFRKGGDAAGL